MQISIFFNWPQGCNSARVSLWPSDIKDQNRLFRVGIIKKGEADTILLKSEWVSCDEMRDLGFFDANRWDKIIVEKKDSGNSGEDIPSPYILDINREWPIDALGSSVVNSTFVF